MNRKKLIKLATAISDAEVALAVKSYGGHWVLVGDPPEIVHIIDNDIFKKFETMKCMEDDEVFAIAKERYLLSKNLPHFPTNTDLSKYINDLTRTKYNSWKDT
ncbi:MAG: hypothetical protein LBE78_06670 [Burkholderiaceae bacterium]|jgi:hypothetical protein|nr:hypothetical protein [Burkholderiaceae bacterium]